MTNPSTPAKKPRQKKWASELARQQHSNQRRKLAKEAAVREEQTLLRARQEIKNARRRLQGLEANKRVNMVSNGLTPRLRAVMNSWGLDLPVSITPSYKISAHTDFKSITVEYDRSLTHPESDRDGNVLDVSVEDLRQIAAETRGLFYHEVGHNLFTVPLPDLLTLALDQAGILGLKKVVNVRVTNAEEALDAAPAERKPPRWDIPSEVHKAWNVLEDQRMECALAEESPQIASYLTVLVLRNIVAENNGWQRNTITTSHLLTAGRVYLPWRVRKASAKQWNTHSMVQSTGFDAAYVTNLVRRYSQATDALTMLGCVTEMQQVIAAISPTIIFVDDHPTGGYGSKGEPKDDAGEKVERTGQANQRPDEDEEDEDDDTAAGGASDEDAEEDEDGDAAGGEPSKDKDGEDSDSHAEDALTENKGDRTNGVGDGGPNRTEDDWYDVDEDDEDEAVSGAEAEAEDALNDAVQDLADDENVADDVKAMNEAYGKDDGALPTMGGLPVLSDDNLIAKAHTVAADLEEAFRVATADCAPAWISQQRRGVLEPIRYITRQPGDLEFFRQFQEDADPGTDISVSLFLDISGSMGASVKELGAAAWATKVACDSIGIECDVTLFDHNAYRLYGTFDSPDYAPHLKSMGSTDPSDAFNAVLYERRQKKNHLVLVMTDGEWEEPTCYKFFRHDNHQAMLFNYYRSSRQVPMEPNPGMAKRLLFNEAYNIGDLLDIPRALENMLIGLV